MNRNKSFDDIISGKLKKLSADPDNNSWELFEKYLQADTDLNMLSQDMIFDDLIREKSKKMPLGNTPSTHWKVLRFALETISLRKNEIWKARVLEIIAVVIFIFSFHNWTESNQTKGHIDAIAQSVLLNEESQNKLSVVKPDGITLSAKRHQIPSIKYTSNLPALNYHSNETPVFSLHFPDAEWIPGTEDKVLPIAGKQFKLVNSNQTEHDVLIKGRINLNTNAGFEVTHILPTNVSLKYKGEIETYSYKQNEFDTYLSERSALSQESEGDNKPFQPAQKSAEAVYVEKSVALFYAKDINLINTPFDKVYSVASYTKEAFNTSVGAALSFKKEHLSWEGSLRYSALSYVPQIIKEEHNMFADRFFETSLERISFNILTSQLMFKYHFIDSRELSVYFTAGSGVNLITDSDFEITTAIRQGRPGNRSQDQDLRLFDEKSFNQGIFEGGRIRDNFFITGAFGIGADQHLFHNLNIFTQAIYNRHLLSAERGVGPNKDKIHTLSIQGGIRFSLN